MLISSGLFSGGSSDCRHDYASLHTLVNLHLAFTPQLKLSLTETVTSGTYRI